MIGFDFVFWHTVLKAQSHPFAIVHLHRYDAKSGFWTGHLDNNGVWCCFGAVPQKLSRCDSCVSTIPIKSGCIIIDVE